MPTNEFIVSLVVAVFSSTGLFTFIQYLITRKDSKNQKLDDLQKSMDSLKQDIANLHKEVDNMKSDSKADFDLINDNINKTNAIQARIRILRANDELRQDMPHSYEYFRQIHQDITDYTQYCDSHPTFKNNEAVSSIEYINKVYQESLEANNFLA